MRKKNYEEGMCVCIKNAFTTVEYFKQQQQFFFLISSMAKNNGKRAIARETKKKQLNFKNEQKRGKT